MNDNETLIGAGCRDHFAINPLGFLGEPKKELGSVLDLVAGSSEWFSLLLGHHLGEGFLALHHQLIGVEQVAGSLLSS